MNHVIIDRINETRKLMKEAGIDVYVLMTTTCQSILGLILMKENSCQASMARQELLLYQ